MFDPEDFKKELFFITNENFEINALNLFEFQWNNNPIYHQYCHSLSKNPTNVKVLHEIPFLPISFFKTHVIKCGQWNPEKTFFSSGTTQSIRSKHEIKDLSFYHQVTETGFKSAYHPVNEYQIIALLPSYLEQGDSSLISMVSHFMDVSDYEGYFIKDYREIKKHFQDPNQRKLLIGVSYALLDLAQLQPNLDLSNTIVMETGGMKGRRKEMIRNELHEILQGELHTGSIHSEYGMTEIQSQAYASNGYFSFPNWAKCLIRDINDPFTMVGPNKSGGINLIDLANIYSCAFVETQDLGRIRENDDFEVLGRFDNSDIRGCNLMI